MRIAVVALLAAVLSLFTVAASGEDSGSNLRSELNGQPVRLTLPTGTPTGLVVWFHGQGGGSNDRVDGPFLRSLTRQGYAIASSNFHLQSWGNEASTVDTERLVEWAEKEVGLPVTAWISGSMGASVSLNAMLHDVPLPACWYGVKPALSLNRMQNVPTGTKYIKLAYGGAVPVDRNPSQNIDSLPSDVRYRIVASPDDTWVPIAENGGALVDGLEARGIETSFVAASGPHEDVSHWDSGDVLDFVKSCDAGTPGNDKASD